MKGVYKFYQEFGRMGSLEGVFIATKEEVEKAMGKEAYFGEALGKHSEVTCDLDDGNVRFVSDNPEVVTLLEEHELCSGCNPLDYVEQDEEDMIFDADDDLEEE